MKNIFAHVLKKNKVRALIEKHKRSAPFVIGFVAVFVVTAVILAIVLSNRVNYEKAKAPIREKGMISIGLRADLFGFAKKDDETGEIQGYEADVADEIVKRLFPDGIDVYIREINSKTGKVFIKSGELDMTLAAYADGETESYTAYSEPYYTDAVVFYARKGGLKEANQIAGHKVGMVSSSYAGYEDRLEKFFKERQIECEIVGFSSYPDAAEALRLGWIDVFAGDSVLLQTYAAGCVRLPGYVLPHGLRIVLQRNNPELKKAVDEILSQMRRDGTRGLLLEKWQLTDFSE